MRYLALDIETTGLDPLKDQVLEVAMVLADTLESRKVEEWAYFHRRIAVGRITGDVKALVMNAGLLEAIASGGGIAEEMLVEELYSWCVAQGLPLARKVVQMVGGGPVSPLEPITVAGKNVAGFDLPFVRSRWPNFEKVIPWRHRVVDVGSLWLRRDDDVVPSLAECMKRAGIEGGVKHTALDDAQAVVACVQAYFREDM